MVISCCVDGCNNYCVPKYLQVGQKKIITFHCFPSDNPKNPKKVVLRQRWIQAVRSRKPSWKIPKRPYICSEHFCERDLYKFGFHVQVREGVVPTLFATSPVIVKMENSDTFAGTSHTSNSSSKEEKMEPQDLSRIPSARGYQSEFCVEDGLGYSANKSLATLQVQNLELLAKVSGQESPQPGNENDDVATLRAKISQLQTQLEECRVREMQANFRAQQESYRVSESEEKITDLEAEIVTLQAQNSELEGRMTAAEQTVADMWRDLVELEATKDECETKMERVKVQLKAHKEKARKLKAAEERKSAVRKSTNKSKASIVRPKKGRRGRERNVNCTPEVVTIKTEAVLMEATSPERQPSPLSSEETPPSTEQGERKPPRPPNNPERPHQCYECGKLFRLKRTLKNHISCIHQDKYEPLTCDFCKKTYKHRPSLLLHITRHHIVRYGDDRPKCKNCGMTFSLRLEYERHFRLEACFDKGSSVTCEICCRSYNCKDNLKKHIKNKHVVHSGEDMLSCNSCGKKFEFKYNYDAHIRYERCKDGGNMSVSNSKPVTCDICQRTFKHKASLRSHKYLSHSTKEPGLRHVCPYCGRSYSQKGSVNTHIKDMHSNVMQHLCFICGKTYNRKQVLAKHVKTVHGGKTRLSCSLCGKTFKTEFSQRRHMTNIHRDLMHSEKLQ